MTLPGDKLLFLMQVLKDTFNLPQGTDWAFKYKAAERKMFYEGLVELFAGRDREIKDLDISKIKKLD